MSTTTTLRPVAAASVSTSTIAPSAALLPVLALAGSGRAFNAGNHWGTVTLSSAQTGGAFVLGEMEVAFQGGPPPHIHTLEDEAFYVLGGRFEVWAGGRTFEAGAGDIIFAPRHDAHAWRCISEEGGRILALVTPGESFERFFLEMCSRQSAQAPTPEQIAALCALAERHGISMLPPSVLRGDLPGAPVASAAITPASATPMQPRLAPVLTLANGGQAFNAGDHWGHIAISSEQSGGAFTLLDMEVAFQGGPPPHVHTREDETFYIHEGRFEFWVEGETICAGPGDTVFAPRHVPHTWRCVSEDGGRALVLITPGENFERFFMQVCSGAMLADGPPSPEDIAALCALAERHGLRMIPPAA
jgi:quercetin dioxygenase-like cupin family protein